MGQFDIDIHWMRQALVLARQAKEQGEVPVGAVLLLNEKLLACASNQTIAQCDPTAHAEILVFRKAARTLNNHRLLEATLYVTLEPCLMCIGAMIQARIKRLVFSAYDDRRGALTANILQSKGVNHRFLLTDGLLAGESAEILRDFFLQRRHKT
jgi:tRNA(adenine34) deaminase